MPRSDLTETFPAPDATDAVRIHRLERIAQLMDSAVKLPGTRLRIGLDSIIGLIPGVGDAVTMLPSAYIIGSAWQMGIPTSVLARMVGNTLIDTIVGSVPVLGDIFDVGFKGNLRNIALLKNHLDKSTP